MTLNITTKTGSDVATTVKRQFGDESGVQIKDADIIRWINDGQLEIVTANHVLKGKATIASVASQSDYTLPEANIAVIESIQWDGIPVQAITQAELEAFIQDYPNSFSLGIGTPTIWYEWGGVVTFWPVPQAVGTITLLYTKVPNSLNVLTDTLSLPDKYFNSLVTYVLAQAYEMDEDWDASSFKHQQLGQHLDTMADEERTTRNITYPVISVVDEY